jgi:hypothetical protein
MALSAQPQPSLARATAPVAPPKVAPAVIEIANKADDAILTRANKSEIYAICSASNLTMEQQIDKVVAYLLKGLKDGTTTVEEWDKRRAENTQINAAIQVLRRQLGQDQLRELVSREYADFQRIQNETGEDVAEVQNELGPLLQLGELYERFGVGGNIIERMNQAKIQKADRDAARARQLAETNDQIAKFRIAIDAIDAQMEIERRTMNAAWFGKGAIEARIINLQADRDARQKQLEELVLAPPPAEPTSEESPELINEEILKLQDIGGAAFRETVTDIKDHTELTLAKMSVNFDAVITGLLNARGTFTTMDRNCSEATMMLSVLQVAVQKAEVEARKIAMDAIIPTPPEGTPADPMADLKRMESEQRSEQLLEYTAALGTFNKEIAQGVASLRIGKSTIGSVLRMNAIALEQANTNKLTGMANMSDAVAITVGAVVDMANRAAGRALADGLAALSATAEQGTQRLVAGERESIKQHNEQLQQFVDNLVHLREVAKQISVANVDAIQETFKLVENINTESGALGDATTEVARAAFNARSGVTVEKPVEKEEAAPETQRFGLLRGRHS